jgi:hypothetical protein
MYIDVTLLIPLALDAPMAADAVRTPDADQFARVRDVVVGVVRGLRVAGDLLVRLSHHS